MCGVGSYVTSPPSPTRHVFPNTLVDSTAAILVTESPAASSVESAPFPLVSSLICSGASPELASTVFHAPRLEAIFSLSVEISTAIILAPISLPNIVAANPTGPCPKTATVSRPDISSFLSA